MFRRILFLAVPASFLSLSPVPGQDAGALSPRNANYTIEVRLDSAQKTLEGKEILTWRNLMQMPAQELWFHLYWNAWKNNRSSWMQEALLSRRGARIPEEGDWSYCEVKSVKVLPAGFSLRSWASR